MKFSKCIVTAAGFLFFCLVSYTASAAPDCPGAKYAGSGTCQSAGLDTHKGVCEPGQLYETLCDDDSRGYKTCSGPKKCQNSTNDCIYWDFSAGKPCPSGYINPDCKGGCGTKK
ncbi:hypothetical protein VU01_11504 [Candidatus Electrothrix marina]|uniref:Uncharacterized protein n=1 Tax=Candidatus Electrothrix marina TaxID=1859130 RepID=A0A3S3QKC9_9BACT|nr:hypothetical protein VT99_11973 [Candidatus Electrothrix marina]RWX50485.1 hypothetical protein VU00_10694 [Candidatus Electrothrix marina]RWX51369.1 hypothetical protein VU01_11504 [Candidatus Electrothrix marina]